jgi:S1-C subfamily serine protease
VIVTQGALAAVGAPVFNEQGKAIGFVNAQPRVAYLLHATGGSQAEFFQNPMAVISALQYRPSLFHPTSEILQSLNDPPSPEHPLEYPWMGAALTGLEKDITEVFGLKDQVVIEVSDVVPNSPCAKAGLKTGMKIVKFNGQPLDRGDEAGDIPRRLTRRVQRLKPGTVVTFTVMTEKDKPLQDLKMTLEKRPVPQNELPRFWAEDLGFSVRDITFHDAYTRKQPVDIKGVLVALVRPQSAAANARLENEHIIQSLNGTPVTGREQFKAEYEKLRAEKPKEAAVLVVLTRSGQTQTIRIEPPQ